MINHLRKRFIFFSVLVISGIVITIAIFAFAGGHSDFPVYRYIFIISLVVLMVFVGSWLISNVAIKPIKEAWQKQLDFTADASHELRTPIAVMQTNLELVMDSPDEPVGSQMKWLKNIEAENKRMAKLVDDLLTLSRADTDQPSLEVETFMLDEVILETLAPFGPLAREKKIRLDVYTSENFSFNGDKKRIKQLLIILVDNALAYTDSLGTITVSLSFGQRDREAVLTVSDTGCGIELENLEKIFDRFFRVTKTRELHREGSGLGLSIAKWIVQEHGGEIEVTSKVGVGTTFTVHLPQCRK